VIAGAIGSMGSISEAKPFPEKLVRRDGEESSLEVRPHVSEVEEGKGVVYIKFDEQSGEVSSSVRIKETMMGFRPGSPEQEKDLTKISVSNDEEPIQQANFEVQINFKINKIPFRLVLILQAFIIPT
jgi:hypothetical protein